MSLGENIRTLRQQAHLSQEKLAELVGVSRQAVNDNLTRTEALLRRMEENIGSVKRDMLLRKALEEILDAATVLDASSDPIVTTQAKRIIAAAQSLEE